MLKKLEKFFVKVLEAEEIADKAAGGDGAVLNRAGGARKILEAEEIADKIAGGGEAVRDKTAEEVEAVRKAAGRVEEPGVESPVEAVHDKTAGGVEAIIDKAGEAVEVVDKVEEPGVDAKVVEGPDLARSQLLEKIRRLEVL